MMQPVVSERPSECVVFRLFEEIAAEPCASVGSKKARHALSIVLEATVRLPACPVINELNHHGIEILGFERSVVVLFPPSVEHRD